MRMGCMGWKQIKKGIAKLLVVGMVLQSMMSSAVKLEVQAASTPIIADHEVATLGDLKNVPKEWMDAAANLQIYYVHTSHGSQVTDGLNGLATFSAQNSNPVGYTINQPIDDHYETDLGNSNWPTITRNYLNSNSGVDVVMWSWCGQVSGSSQKGIEDYLAAMTKLEQDYPNVKFIYMTGHLDGTGVSGNLNVRNNQIRDYCRTNGKLLLDFADIESYDPDGNYYLDKGVNDECNYDSDGNGSLDKNWASDWQNSHSENVEWYHCGSAHSQPLNANMKAYAACYLFARIAGWDGTSTGGKTSITTAQVSDISNQVYDGTPKTPSVTVSIDTVSGNMLLVEDEDYTLQYQNNVNAGTAKVVVTGMDKYTGVLEKTFTIAKADQAMSVSPNSIIMQRTDGSQALNIENRVGALSCTSEDANVVTVTNTGVLQPVKVGETTVHVTAAGNANYNPQTVDVDVEVIDTIAPVIMNTTALRLSNSTARVSFQASEAGFYEYSVVNVSENSQLENVSSNSRTCKQGSNSFSLSNLDPDAKVIYISMMDQNGNFSEVVQIGLDSWGFYNIANAKVKGVLDDTYSGEAIEPSVEVVYNYKTLTPNQDYTVSYANNVNAGNASVIVKGMGDYAGTNEVFFTIHKANQIIRVDKSSYQIPLEMGSLSLNATCESGDISYQVDDEAVVSVSQNGQVQVNGTGKTLVHLSVSGNENYNAATKSIAFEVKELIQIVNPFSNQTIELGDKDTVATSANTILLNPKTPIKPKVYCMSDLVKGTLIWELVSDDPAIKLSKDGIIEAVSSVSANEVQIRISAYYAGERYERYFYVLSTPKATVVQISQSQMELKLSDNPEEAIATLNATIDSGNTGKIAVWSSSDTRVATVDQSGVVTAHKKGVALIRAKAPDQSGKYATCKVTVTQMATDIIVKNATTKEVIDDLDTIYIVENGTIQLSGTTDKDASNKGVIFDAFDNGNAIVVSKSGKITLSGNAEPGDNFAVTCMSQDLARTKIFSVIVAPTTAGIQLDQVNYQLILGGNEGKESVSINTTVPEYENATLEPDYYLTSSNPKVVKVVDDHTITGVGKGTATVRVLLADGSKKSVLCKVQVIQLAQELKIVNGDNKEQLSNDFRIQIAPGKKVKLTGSTDRLASDQRVRYSVSGNAGVQISKTGEISVLNDITLVDTEAVVTCSSYDGNVTMEGVVQIVPSAVSITLSGNKVELVLGGDSADSTEKIEAVITGYGNSKPMLKYTSSNPKVVTVSGDGTLVAVGKGSATVTCKLLDGTGKSATCKVTVRQLVTDLKLYYDSYKLPIEENSDLVIGVGKQLKVNAVTSKQASDRSVVWSVDSVSGNVLVKNGVIYLKKTAKPGERATIECASKDGNRVITFDVKVIESAYAIQLSEPKMKLAMTKENHQPTQMLSARIFSDKAKTKEVLDCELLYTSSNEKVVKVNQDGLVTAMGKGTALIHVRALDGSGKSAICLVSVIQEVEEIVILSNTRSLMVGKSMVLSNKVLPSSANNKGVTYSSSDPTIATISSSGKVVGVSAGKVIIRVTAKDASKVIAEFPITIQ